MVVEWVHVQLCPRGGGPGGGWQFGWRGQSGGGPGGGWQFGWKAQSGGRPGGGSDLRTTV